MPAGKSSIAVVNIAYVTTYDASDVTNWSGLGYFISECLKDKSTSLEYIGPLSHYDSLFLRIKRRYYRYVLKQGFEACRHPLVAKGYADQVSDKLIRTKADVIVSPGTIPVAYLKCNRPIVFWTDATFAGLVNFYPGYYNFSKEGIRIGHELEQSALDNCRLALFSSEWAAKTALDNYSVNSSKVHVVPFGANVSSKRSSKEIEAIVASRSSDKCKLLFIGFDWKRKGGDIAIEIARELNRLGITAELHVVGPEAGALKSLPSFVIPHGRIDKLTSAGQNKIENLLADAHFMILPSRAECCAVVFAEASSYGVPSITTNVGGVGTAVKNGVNGWAFSIDSEPLEYASYIFKLMSNYVKYKELAISAFNEYTLRLNWDVAGNRVRGLLRSVL